MKKCSSIMKLFYDGPCRLDRIKFSEAHSKFLREAAALEKEIENKLNGADGSAELLKRYNDAMDEINSIETELVFKKAIRYGVLLGMELAQE